MNYTNEDFIRELKSKGTSGFSDKINDISALFGKDGNAVKDFLSNEDAVLKLTSSLSKSDIQKLKIFMDNPDLITKLLSSDKNRQSLIDALKNINFKGE